MVVFSVQAKLPSHQHVRLLGNHENLGRWLPHDSVELQPSPGDLDCSYLRTWSVSVDLDENEEHVLFRFLLCENLIGSVQTDQFSIVKCGPCQESSVLNEIIGGVLDVNDPSWCEGWLVYDSEIHLTIHNSSGFPINIFGENNGSESGKYKIKMTAMNMDKGCFTGRKTSNVNIKIVGEYEGVVKNQEESGVCYDPTKHYSFVTRVFDLNHTAFKVEVYLPDNNNSEEFKTVGHGFIQPIHLKSSCGIIDVGLAENELPTGSVQVEYVIIKPLDDKCFHNIENWTDRNWQNAGKTLNMGHRGCGSTFGSARSGFQENTIESFLKAYEKGADGLELDVHVTKDLIPVIYHDLYLNAALQTKNESKCSQVIPVCDLTYQELQDLKIIHSRSAEFNDELQHRNGLQQKLFPTLEEVLTNLPENFPFELEVKYLETEQGHEDAPFLDINLYVDTLLKSVSKNIGNRKIILMCFSPVIVQLLSRKQKKFPVKIGVCGETVKYPVYKDIRIRTIGRVVGFAQSEKILGISCLCDNIITENKGVFEEIKKRNLVVSTWGEDDNKSEIRELQRQMGVDVVCFDRIDEREHQHSQPRTEGVRLFE